jgi:hypothetical protein
MAAIYANPHRPHPLSKILARLALVGLLFSVSAILATSVAQQIKCERLTSDFGGDFTGIYDGDFGVNAIECRTPRIEDSPKLRIAPDLSGVAIGWKGRWVGYPLPPSPP